MAQAQETPVDLYGLLETTILHELTHTPSGGESLDLSSQVSGFRGWHYVTSDLEGDAYNNADSLAFMGLVSKLVQLGFRVDSAGDLHQLAASKLAMLKRRSHFNGSRT